MTPDQFIEQLFDQKIFTILYGVIGYFVILWSLESNKYSRRRKARLKEAESLEERKMILEDPKYKFNAKEWLKDQKDDIIVVLIVGIGLIEFDDFTINTPFGQQLT